MLILLAVPLVAGAQKRPPKQKSSRKQAKEQVDKKATRKAELTQKLNKAQAHHLEIQDKKTRKRMRKNARMRKKAQKGRSIPFYKRWFRRDKFK